MKFLLEMNNRYPHAWYARRFFNKVNVSEKSGPHFGMGLDCYVQWTSPIRRITDLKVHSALKRYLRRKRVNEMLQSGLSIPSEVTSMDLGYDITNLEGQRSEWIRSDSVRLRPFRARTRHVTSNNNNSNSSSNSSGGEGGHVTLNTQQYTVQRIKVMVRRRRHYTV